MMVTAYCGEAASSCGSGALDVCIWEFADADIAPWSVLSIKGTVGIIVVTSACEGPT